MNFDLTAPCGNCPFRTDIAFDLRAERVEDICDGITRQQGTFSCHKTTRAGGCADRAKEQHCAGALIMLERMERPNQMMRIAERFGGYDSSKLHMDAPVFEDADAMIDHYVEQNA